MTAGSALIAGGRAWRSPTRGWRPSSFPFVLLTRTRSPSASRTRCRCWSTAKPWFSILSRSHAIWTRTYPDRPSLFGGAVGRAEARFINKWVATVHGPLLGLVVEDIRDHVDPKDRTYFTESRTKRLGAPLEDIQAGREARLPEFRASLAPFRALLAEQPYMCGRDAGLWRLHLVWRLSVGAGHQPVSPIGARRSRVRVAPPGARPVRRIGGKRHRLCGDGRLRGI